MSKFEEKLIKKINAEKDQKTIAERSFRKASSILKQQISALEYKRVDLQIRKEQMEEKLNDTTYCENFSIINYDNAKKAVETVEEELADLEATLEARRALLESWA